MRIIRICEQPLNFSSVKPGDRLRVKSFVGLNAAYRNKLLSLGLTPGTEFLVHRIAPLGDPIEVKVRGFRLSLRRNEAAAMECEPL